MKADLHAHGPFFEPCLLERQGYTEVVRGRKTLLELIADKCLDEDIGLCGIISDTKVRFDAREDRFGYLVREIKKLPSRYRADKLENIAIVIEKDNKTVYLLNGQSAVVQVDGRKCEHTVIGRNDVPDFKPLNYTIEWCKDRGIIQVAEHPFAELGIGGEELKKHLGDYDALEWNAQLVPYGWLGIIPIIGKDTRRANKEAERFSKEYNMPLISVSDAHTLESIGIAYIEFDDKLLDCSNGENLIASLRNIIREGKFIPVKNYVPLTRLFRWNLIEQVGRRLCKYLIKRQNKEIYGF